MFTEIATIDNLRSLGNASIGASFTAVGSRTPHPTRLICFTNNTDGDMFFSDDGVNNKLFVAKGSFKLFDITTNRDNNSVQFSFLANTQFYVAYATMPSTGSVYIEVIYGQPYSTKV